ncbi:Cytochrome P450, partial [Operophtera brumata]
MHKTLLIFSLDDRQAVGSRAGAEFARSITTINRTYIIGQFVSDSVTMIEWLLLLLTVAWTVVFRYRRRNMYRLAATIPALKEELPIIGVAHYLTGNTEGKCLTCLGISEYEVVVNPVDLEMVLKKCLEKDDLHRFIRRVIGYGEIFAP